MSSPSKLAAALIAAVALVLGASLAVPALLDGEYLARLATEKARAALQREVQIRDLRVQLLPAPTIHIAHLALANPDWASRRQLLQAEQLSARLEWLPLLRGRLVVSGIAAQALEMNLETDAQGRNGWDLPKSDKPVLVLDRLRHADLASATIWRKAAQEATREWRLQSFKAQGEPGWKQLAVRTDVLANGERMQLSVKLADASDLGQARASSEGEASAQFKGARLELRGRLPLSAGMESYALQAVLRADSLAAPRRFFNREGLLPTAPLELDARLRREQQGHVIEKLDLKLGEQRLAGQGQLIPAQERWRLQGTVESKRLDWPQAMLDLGNASPPKKPESELLPTHPLPWRALKALQAIDVDLDTSIGVLVTRGDLQLKQWQSQVQITRSKLTLADTRFQLLDGSGRARIQLEPQRSEMQLALQVQGLSLQEWFKRRRERAGMVSEGPMNLKAELKSRGKSWKELAANMNGPLSISVGALSVHSKAARDTEAMLVDLLPAFSEEKADEVRVNCLASELRFVNGRAQSKRAVGVRGPASKLLLGGTVDFRQQKLDLAGRVRAAEGVTLGIATLAGDVRIAGPLQQPKVSVEPVGALARLGAAIATTGLSVLATAVYDAATSEEDPCAMVSAVPVRAKPAQSDPRAAPRTADTR